MHYYDGCHHGSTNELLVSCTSPTLSNGKLKANKSGGYCTPENYHLDSFHIPKKRKVGNVGHKSPENNALVKARISQDLDAIFDNDITMDSFHKASQEDPSLPMRNTNDVFKFKNWRSMQVETCTEYRTILGNRTTNCILGNCTADCTDLGSIQYKKLGILTSKQWSRITNSDFNSLTANSVLAGEKLVLFGKYVLNF